MPDKRNSIHRPNGFTLVEMLVSIAILVLLVLLITQLFNSTATTITRQSRRTDTDAEARIVFDRLSADFARMTRRSDLDFYGKDTVISRGMNGNDQLAFYATVPGYYSSPSPTPTPTRNSRNPISLIAYSLAFDPTGRPQLVRLAKGLTWESSGGWPSVTHLPAQILSQWANLFQSSTISYTGMQDSDFTVVSESVVRFEYGYLLQPTDATSATFSTVPYNPGIAGHSTRDFYQDVTALIVSVAILNPSSRVIVNNYSQLTSPGLFPDASGTEIAVPWQAKVLQPGFASSAQIPQQAASAIRVYQRRFNLTGPNSQ